jgi:sugar phosphate isomerase/epimerase
VRITALDKHDRIRATDELKRALEVADRISIERFVLHLGAPEEDYDPHKIDSAFNAIDELGVFARGLGVEILLENFSNEHCSADRLNLFLAMTHVDLGYCFDAAEARAGEGFEDQFEKMRERIRMVRLDEPRREPSELELLAGLDAKTPFVLALEEDPELEDPLGDAGDALDRLEEWLNDG